VRGISSHLHSFTFFCCFGGKIFVVKVGKDGNGQEVTPLTENHTLTKRLVDEGLYPRKPLRFRSPLAFRIGRNEHYKRGNIAQIAHHKKEREPQLGQFCHHVKTMAVGVGDQLYFK